MTRGLGGIPLPDSSRRALKARPLAVHLRHSAVTHTHLDHVGALGLLLKRFPDAKARTLGALASRAPPPSGLFGRQGEALTGEGRLPVRFHICGQAEGSHWRRLVLGDAEATLG